MRDPGLAMKPRAFARVGFRGESSFVFDDMSLQPL
jgi:hypothetical protein